MDEKLKPCPFCNGTKATPVLEELNSECKKNDTGGAGWRITCYGCKLGTWTHNGWTREQAIRAWNDRTDAPAGMSDGELIARAIILAAASHPGSQLLFDGSANMDLVWAELDRRSSARKEATK